MLGIFLKFNICSIKIVMRQCFKIINQTLRGTMMHPKFCKAGYKAELSRAVGQVQ